MSQDFVNLLPTESELVGAGSQSSGQDGLMQSNFQRENKSYGSGHTGQVHGNSLRVPTKPDEPQTNELLYRKRKASDIGWIRHSANSLLIVAVVMGASFATVIGINSGLSRRSLNPSLVDVAEKRPHVATDTTEYLPITLLVANEYSTPSSLKLYSDWKYLVEPWRNTTLTALRTASGSEIEWSILYTRMQKEHSINVAGTGSEVTAVFPHAAQWYNITVREIRQDGKVITARFSSICKYVRRELRSLSNRDRNRYFSALEKIHRLPLSEGQAKYGAKFANQEVFLVKHLSRDSLTNCNFFHGCSGFLTGHAAFQLELEQSLQAIDPILAAPYWDPSIDDVLYEQNWSQESPIVSKDWLGPITGNPDIGYVIDEGRWAYVEIPTDFSRAEHNAYGRLTQTYNNDDSKYVWRTNSVCGLPSKARLPGCSALKGILALDNLGGVRAKMETDWHGTLHPGLGGATQCPYSFETLLESHPDWSELLEFVAMLQEVTWDVAHALNYLVCPDSCEEGTSFEDCACACPDFQSMNASVAYEFLDELGMLDRFYGCQRGTVFMNYTNPSWDKNFQDPVASALEDAGAMVEGATDKMYVFKKKTSNGTEMLSPEEQAELMVFIAESTCHPGRVSPFMTPLAATNDPIFWVSHGSFEKIWAAKRLLPEYRSKFNETWDYFGESSCFGRNWDDAVPFRDFEEGIDHTQDYTQRELYGMFDPMNEKLPYIFDDFEWSHCHTST